MSKAETAVQGFNHTDLYRLDGKIPWLRAIPYGVQHILAMFVANLAPILIVAGAAGLDSTTTGSLVQSAMLIAGIGTLVQLFPPRGPYWLGVAYCYGHQLYIRHGAVRRCSDVWIQCGNWRHYGGRPD